MIKPLLLAALVVAPMAMAGDVVVNRDIYRLNNGAGIGESFTFCKFGYQFLVVDGHVVQVYKEARNYSNPPQPMKCQEQ